MSHYKALMVVLAAVLALWAYGAWRNEQAVRFFTSALAQAGIPAGAPLEEKERAYARALAERNPLLALPGAQLDALDRNVARLRQLEQRLREMNASSTNAALLDSLYPDGFLGALSGAERTRRAFIDSGSAADEAAYNAAMLKAFAAYRSDAGEFAKAFAAAVPAASGKFATDGDIVSRADTLAAVGELMRRANAAADRFAARMRCVGGSISACRAHDLDMPALAVSPEYALAPQQQAQAEAVRALSAQAHGQPGIAEGPMLLLPSTECAKNMGGGAPLFALYEPADLGAPTSPFPLYVGNIRFNTASASPDSAFYRLSEALRHNVTYLLDSPMLHYSCPEISHDSGKLLAMEDAYAFAQAQGLSAYASTSGAKAPLAALEKKGARVLTQRQVESYLQAANALPLPAPAASRVRELTLAYLFSSARFDAQVGELLADEESNSALAQKGWPISLEVPYMFFVRSSFSMLLLGDNSSAMGEALALFPPNTLSADKQPFVYYSQLPRTPAKLRQLVHDMHFFYIVHVDPTLVSGLVQKN